MEDEALYSGVTLYRGFAKTVGTNDYDQMDGAAKSSPSATGLCR